VIELVLTYERKRATRDCDGNPETVDMLAAYQDCVKQYIAIVCNV
jgi:hypothetical protein